MEAIGGKNAAMLFPRRISPSVVGVAKRGSRLFSTFSPTRLYEAIAAMRGAEMMMKKKVNAGRSIGSSAAGMPPPPLRFPANSTTEGRRIEMRRGRAMVEKTMFFFLLNTLRSFAAMIQDFERFMLLPSQV